MTKLTKGIWIFALLLLCSFAISTNFSIVSNSSPTSDINQNFPIVIGYSNWIGWWPWAIAESEGLFAKHNLDVELKWYDDYSSSLNDLNTGVIDGNCQTLNDTISFAASAKKGETIVLVNDNSYGNDKIIAANGISKIEDLKNKQVLIEEGVVDHFLLSLALEQRGLTRNDINIVNLETGAAAAAFRAGEGDAVGAFPPFWLEALKREGATEIASSKDFPGAIADLLVVTQELVERNPQKVQALIEVWFDLLEFMSSNPTKAEEIMARRAEISAEQLQKFKQGVKMFDLNDNLQAFEPGDSMKNMPFAAKKITAFLQNYTDFGGAPDLNSIFNNSFLIKVTSR
jgi:NitT/TauT family transport system substrate-binding protein